MKHFTSGHSSHPLHILHSTSHTRTQNPPRRGGGPATGAAVLGLLLVLGLACHHDKSLPHFIDDPASYLSAHERERIASLNTRLLEDLDIHIQVVILAQSPADINRKAAELFEDHALGSKTRGSRGVLFLVDPIGDQVRLEIGYGLEHLFTDAFVGYVERRQMTPFFLADRVGPGVEATVELLVGRALDRDEQPVGTGPPLPPVEHDAGGAGARTKVDIGSGAPEKQATPLAGRFGPQPSPRLALQTYMRVLELHIKDPDLGLYTPATRRFFKSWTVTDAQQDSELDKLERLGSRFALFRDADLAVVRFPLEDRRAPPYLLRRTEEGWMLDFAAMNRLIGFNHRNEWFFRTTDHSFAFAFEDVKFDRHGFPHGKGVD